MLLHRGLRDVPIKEANPISVAGCLPHMKAIQSSSSFVRLGKMNWNHEKLPPQKKEFQIHVDVHISKKIHFYNNHVKMLTSI